MIPTSATILSPQTRIKQRYGIEQLIGQGGMGAVYRAIDERSGSPVALKQLLVYDPGIQADKAFEREAKILAGLDHPALPRVIDFFSDPHGQFLVMEYIAGDDLAALLEQRGAPFPPTQVLAWAEQLLQILTYLHEHQPPIIHRDIKPHNLKVNRAGQVVLLDFGLAKGLTALQGKEKVSTISLGSIAAFTPHYAPLEQIQGTGTEPRSDLYALAATLHHLLTAVPPVDALTRASAFINGQHDPQSAAHLLNPQMSPAISAVLLHALTLRIDKRPVTAAAMQAQLQAAQQEAQPYTGDTILVSSPAVSSPASLPTRQHQRPRATDTAGILSAMVPHPRLPLHVHHPVRQRTNSLIEEIAFHPAGHLLASGHRDGSIRLWKVANGREVQRLQGHTWVMCLAFSPDGTLLASGHKDGFVRLWEMETGCVVRTLGQRNGEVIESIAFSPDGHTLIVQGRNADVWLWEMAAGEQHHHLARALHYLRCITCSPDGRLLASGHRDGAVRVWDMSGGSELCRLSGHIEAVSCVAFSVDSVLLASGSNDRSVRLWDVAGGYERKKLEGHTASVRSVIFSPDGYMLASGSDDRTIRLWESDSGRELACLQEHTAYVWSVAFSADGTLLACGTRDGTLWMRGINILVVHEWQRIEEAWAEWQQELRRQRYVERNKERQARQAEGCCEVCGERLSVWRRWRGITRCAAHD